MGLSFTEITTAAGGDISDELATVENSPGSSEGVIVYNSSNGGLFYNANGSDPGLGEGGQFATLNDTPILMADNFVLRS